MNSSSTYRIAINTIPLAGKIPQGDPLWGRYNDSFDNRSIDPMEIFNEIYMGHGYTAWMNGRRSKDHFVCAQFSSVDLDTDDYRSTLDHIELNPFYQMYCYGIYTTASHNTPDPKTGLIRVRSRVMVLLEDVVTNPAGYEVIQEFLADQFDGADKSCVDAARFFYGSKDADIRINGAVLNHADLTRLGKAWRRIKAQKEEMAAQPRHSRQKKEDAGRTEKDENSEDGTPLSTVSKWLDNIDPWSVDYNRWVGIMATMKREYGDAARQVVIRWADGRDGEVEKKWDKHLDNDHRKPMGLGTIRQLAGA